MKGNSSRPFAALYKKELAGFFSSLTGYLAIVVFLVLTGLSLWVFKSDFNILDYGFAGMEGLCSS